MLELNRVDFQIYKDNLNLRSKKFTIERKRGERLVVVNGKKVAKYSKNNSISYLKRDESKQILSLFASVKKSVNNYIVKQDFTIDRIEKKYNSVFANRTLFDAIDKETVFYYVDVKHCYWRIAYLFDIISEYYYNKILKKPDLKLYRNMALACIIAPREKEYYQNGENIMTIKEDVRIFNIIYENIRHYAWNIFGSLCYERIGKENCIGYFTDGIMIFPDDVKKVSTVLARRKLKFRVQQCKKIGYREYVNLDEGEVRKI